MEKLEKWYKRRFKETMGCPNGIAQRYANGVMKHLSEERGEVAVVEVVKVDKETLKHIRHPLYVPPNLTEEETLKLARKGCNVGDFVILSSGKVFRRIRGGYREATDEDMAELVGSTI